MEAAGFPQQWYLSTRLHDITSQKTVITMLSSYSEQHSQAALTKALTMLWYLMIFLCSSTHRLKCIAIISFSSLSGYCKLPSYHFTKCWVTSAAVMISLNSPSVKQYYGLWFHMLVKLQVYFLLCFVCSEKRSFLCSLFYDAVSI
jgi:hypothetical protein